MSTIFAKKSKLPLREIVLNSNSPFVQEQVMDVFHKAGINIYEQSLKDGYDPKYPFLKWDGIRLNQTRTGPISTDPTVDDFLDMFIERVSLTVQLTPDYSAEIIEGFIKVGCQTIPIEKVRQVLSSYEHFYPNK
jgi:hypothetical protein